jgi:hypothetical protein
MVDCLLICAYEFTHPSHGNFVQADTLDRGPDNRQATGFRREDVNLIGAFYLRSHEPGFTTRRSTAFGMASVNIAV